VAAGLGWSWGLAASGGLGWSWGLAALLVVDGRFALVRSPSARVSPVFRGSTGCRELVRERLGVGPGSAPEGRLPFSPTAKDAFRSAHRFGMGELGTEHMLIVLTACGEGGVSEILRGLGANPNRIRFETKKRLGPGAFQGLGQEDNCGPRSARASSTNSTLGTQQICGEVRCWLVADTGPVAALPVSLSARPEPLP
jgi:hypothetical protein